MPFPFCLSGYEANKWHLWRAGSLFQEGAQNYSANDEYILPGADQFHFCVSHKRARPPRWLLPFQEDNDVHVVLIAPGSAKPGHRQLDLGLPRADGATVLRG